MHNWTGSFQIRIGLNCFTDDVMLIKLKEWTPLHQQCFIIISIHLFYTTNYRILTIYFNLKYMQNSFNFRFRMTKWCLCLLIPLYFRLWLFYFDLLFWFVCEIPITVSYLHKIHWLFSNGIGIIKRWSNIHSAFNMTLPFLVWRTAVL